MDRLRPKKRLFAVPVKVADANPTNQSCESEVVGPGAGEPVAAVKPKPKPQPKTGSLKQTKLFLSNPSLLVCPQLFRFYRPQ